MTWRLLLLLLSIPTILPAQDEEHIRNEIYKLIRFETGIDLIDQPSFIVSIVDEADIYHIGYGSFHPDSNQQAIEHLQFQVGGLTKIFTAHLCQMLSDALASDRVAGILARINLALKNVTIDQLLSHTSGLPKLPSNLGMAGHSNFGRYAKYGWEDLLSFLQQATLDSDSHHYSHVNYALIQIVLEELFQQPFSEILTENLLKPHDMHSTGIGLPGSLVKGHTRTGRAVEPWKFASFEASEGMYSSAHDLARYMQTNLLDTHKNGFSKLLEPITKISKSKRSYCGKAWHFFEHKRHRIYLHSGKTDGQGGVVQFVPKTRTAVIILTNRIASFQGLGMEILRMVNDNWKRLKTDG